VFKLYVISTANLRDEPSFAYQDLLEGFERYKKESAELGFDIHYVEDTTSDLLVKSEVEVNGIFTIWGNGFNYLKFSERPFRVATFACDTNWWTENQLEIRLSLFDSSDVVFIPYYRAVFKYDVYKVYDSLKDKFVSLYWWVTDKFVFDNEWDDRKNKILLAGACGETHRVREEVRVSGHPLVEVLPHCGYTDFSHPYHGANFLNYASTFKGFIGTPGSPAATYYDSTIIHPLNYHTMEKIFIGLGCGCLSFLEETSDFEELGLIKYKHYVPIDISNFRSQFDEYLGHPYAEQIAKEGQNFVSKNHSTKQRVLTVLNTLKERWL
jgi:hypothetical protein